MQDASQWRLTNGIGIPYKVVSREGEFSYEGATATEEYIIQASDLLNMAIYGFPEPVVFGNTLRYPQQPVMPGLGTLVPKKVAWRSHDPSRPCDPFNSDPSAPIGTYCDYCNITVSYGVAPENDQEQDPNDPFTFLEVTANASGVFLNSPLNGQAEWEVPTGSTFSYTNVNGEPSATGESGEVMETNIPHTVTETQVEWSVKWPRIPYQFWNGTLMGRMRAKLGKVNDAAMPLLFNAPADTILFLGYQTSTSYTWRAGRAGQGPVDLSMKFLEKNFKDKDDVQITHQHLWRPNYGWRKLKIDGDYLYSQANLNAIWSP